MVVMPLERVALSSVIEDGPASEMELMDVDRLDDLSEGGMYILSEEELCVQGVRSMVERIVGVWVVWLSIRCLLWALAESVGDQSIDRVECMAEEQRARWKANLTERQEVRHC